MKYSTLEVLRTFQETKPKKLVFGNYRIEGNKLIYRAQTTEECTYCHDRKDFPAWKKLVGEKIAKLDGKLVIRETGKTVLLESLTPESKTSGLAVLFYETDLISVKFKIGETDEYIYFGNSDILTLVGRTVSYGNVSENREETEIQREMKRMEFHVFPFNSVDFSDVKFTLLERGLSTPVSDEIGRAYYSERKRVSHDLQGDVLFKLNSETFLAGVDRREIKFHRLNSFLTEISADVSTIADAYETLKPKEVVKAESEGLKVKRVGRLFLIPCDAPELPELTLEEKLCILGESSTYSLSGSDIKYLTGKDYSATKFEKRSLQLLKKVPRARSIDLGRKYTVETAIDLNKKTYVKGKIESTDRASTELESWHYAISFGEKLKTESE